MVCDGLVGFVHILVQPNIIFWYFATWCLFPVLVDVPLTVLYRLVFFL